MARIGEVKSPGATAETVAEFDADKTLIGTRLIDSTSSGNGSDLLDRDGVDATVSAGGVTTHDLAGVKHNSATIAQFNAKISDGNFDDSGDSRTPLAHNLAGSLHNADTLANLNTKVSDATLDDSGDPRTPTAHDLAGSEHNADTLANLNTKVSDATLDTSSASRTPLAHDLAGSLHNTDTLVNLNAKISDATLDDSSASRTPSSHNIGGAEHGQSTIAQFNTKVSDANMDDANSERTAIIHGLGDTNRHSGATKADLNALVSDATLLAKDDVINLLTSTVTDQPLSAAQGKVLKDLIDGWAAPDLLLAKAHVASFDVGAAPGAITVTNTTNVTSATGTSPSTGWTKVAIAFTTPLASADYMVGLEVSGSRHAYNQPLVLNKTTAGFDIEISENGSATQSCELEFRVLDY